MKFITVIASDSFNSFFPLKQPESQNENLYAFSAASYRRDYSNAAGDRFQ